MVKSKKNHQKNLQEPPEASKNFQEPQKFSTNPPESSRNLQELLEISKFDKKQDRGYSDSKTHNG